MGIEEPCATRGKKKLESAASRRELEGCPQEGKSSEGGGKRKANQKAIREKSRSPLGGKYRLARRQSDTASKGTSLSVLADFEKRTRSQNRKGGNRKLRVLKPYKRSKEGCISSRKEKNTVLFGEPSGRTFQS